MRSRCLRHLKLLISVDDVRGTTPYYRYDSSRATRGTFITLVSVGAGSIPSMASKVNRSARAQCNFSIKDILELTEEAPSAENGGHELEDKLSKFRTSHSHDSGSGFRTVSNSATISRSSATTSNPRSESGSSHKAGNVTTPAGII